MSPSTSTYDPAHTCLGLLQPVLVARKDGYADPLRIPGRKPEAEYADEIRLNRVRVIRGLREVQGML